VIRGSAFPAARGAKVGSMGLSDIYAATALFLVFQP
jgi:hypothetical protein